MTGHMPKHLGGGGGGGGGGTEFRVTFYLLAPVGFDTKSYDRHICCYFLNNGKLASICCTILKIILTTTCHRVYGPAQFPVRRTVFPYPREYGPPDRIPWLYKIFILHEFHSQRNKLIISTYACIYICKYSDILFSMINFSSA